MDDHSLLHLRVLAPREGETYASFFLYVPLRDGYTCEYRFLYVQRGVNPALSYGEGPNDPANSALFRICEAHVGHLSGEEFLPKFRALQGGEIAFALQEKGAGDFVGGYHGDEVLNTVTLMLDGTPCLLSAPAFLSGHTVTFSEASVIYRCNMPDVPLLSHRQTYTVREDTLLCSHSFRWLTDSHPIAGAYLPMLTAARYDPAPPHRLLSDTVEFFDTPGGRRVGVMDTTPYGLVATGEEPPALRGVPAAAVRVTGRESGFTAEAGLIPRSPLPGAVTAHVWPRYGADLDSKIYFEVGGGTAPKAGTLLEADVYYRLAYAEKE